MRGALLKQLCWRGHWGRGGPPGPHRGVLPPYHWHGGPVHLPFLQARQLGSPLKAPLRRPSHRILVQLGSLETT